MLPDIDSIALFVKAAELGSLTRAAEASSMGLAAASRRISLLEHRMRCTLFERLPKGVELTPAGVTLLLHSKQLLVQLNQMQVDIEDHNNGRRGQLRLFANTSAMAQHLPADLARFTVSDPGLRFIVKERWSSEIVDAVLLGEAYIGIVIEGVPTRGLDCVAYRRDRLAAVVPRGHPLDAPGEVAFAEVLDYDLVALEHGSSLMVLLSDSASLAEKPLKLRTQVRGFEAVCRMVEAGLGVGVLPGHAALPYLQGMELGVRMLADPWAHRRMLICTRPDRSRTMPVARMVTALAGWMD